MITLTGIVESIATMYANGLWKVALLFSLVGLALIVISYAADEETINLYGTIWVINHLIHHKLLSIDEARTAYSQMKEKKRRLPWKIAEAHLLY